MIACEKSCSPHLCVVRVELLEPLINFLEPGWAYIIPESSLVTHLEPDSVHLVRWILAIRAFLEPQLTQSSCDSCS